MSDQPDRPECPNHLKYPQGGCPACQVPNEAGGQQDPVPPAAPATNTQPPATPSTQNLPAGPALAPKVYQVDCHGFGGWPSEEMILAHEERGGRWLAQEMVGELRPGQLRGLLLGRFSGGAWRSNSQDFSPAMMAKWTFCPIDDNGDKLDVPPVLRGKDARRLAESLSRVAPPKEIARRRAEARERLAELDRSVSRMRADARALDKGVLVSKLGDEIQVDGFKDEHIRLALGRKEAQRILSSLPARSPDRRVLVVLRGLPGSGKSTVAQAIVDSDPARWARVSKDDLRQMMVGPNGDLFRFVEDRAREMIVSMTADEMAMSALRMGLDVVVDATNLTNRALNSWHLAAMVVNRDGHGPVLVCERAVPTPVEECIARDKLRGKRSVGEAVIRRLAATVDLPLVDREWGAGS